ncbi:MAG: DUF3352 domain-containing protein [Chloroflexi bacterium]|nr:DUF3352 domain-containing protein [Chloroflexota bacterium]
MSQIVQPAARTPAWRVVVIAAVAVLAVAIGALVGSTLLANRAAAIGAAAAYVPADAPFYVEFRIEPSEAQDASLREILGRFPDSGEIDLDEPLYPQMVAAIDEMLAAEGAGVSWEADVATWFDGRLAFTMTDIPTAAFADPVDPMGVPEVPPMILLLGVTDRTAAEDGIAKLLAASRESPSFTTVEHQGTVIHFSEGTEFGAYAVTDDQVLVGTDAETLQGALDTHADGTGTVAELDEMTKLTDELPDDWLMFMTYDFSDLMAEAMAAGASASPEMAEAFGSLMEHQSLRGAMAISAADGRVLLDAATDAPTGPFAMENADRGLSGEVPGDVLYYSEAGNIGQGFAAVIEPMKDAIADVPDGEEQIRTLESALGADLEELVSWIDDGAIVIGATEGEPYAGMVLVPNDMDAARRRLDQLASFAGLGALDPSSGLTVGEEDVDGVTVTTITWTDPNAGSGMGLGMPSFEGFAVEYAVTDDRAIVGFGDAFVRRVLALEEADSLAAVARYTDAVAEFGGPESAGIAWLDITGVREAIETALGPMLEAGDPGGMYASEIRPWLLPLDRLVGVTRVDGDVMTQRGALLFE